MEEEFSAASRARDRTARDISETTSLANRETIRARICELNVDRRML
jgi:hypothetical protein